MTSAGSIARCGLWLRWFWLRSLCGLPMPRSPKLPAPPPMTGTGLETQLERWLSDCERLAGGRLAWHRHEPKMRGKIRVGGGLPDYEAMYSGRVHLIECKHESGSAMDIGRLDGTDLDCGAGVKPSQARELDRHERAGGVGWILARLELNATTRAKLAQMRLDGSGGDPAAAILRLIPWPTWRGWMARAEDSRKAATCPMVRASIPAAELAGMSYPCRSAAELLKALEQPCQT